MSENKDTRTASQRLDDLEMIVARIFQATDALVKANDSVTETLKDLPLAKEALGLMQKRIESIIQAAAPESGITPAAVDANMVKMNIEEMKAKVASWVAGGALSVSDVATEDSFIVGQEEMADGTVTNARIQFPLDKQGELIKTKTLGAKVGDLVDLGEGKFGLRILELYKVTPPAPPAPALQAVPSPEPEVAPAEAAAPAAEAPQADQQQAAPASDAAAQ